MPKKYRSRELKVQLKQTSDAGMATLHYRHLLCLVYR